MPAGLRSRLRLPQAATDDKAVTSVPAKIVPQGEAQSQTPPVVVPLAAMRRSLLTHSKISVKFFEQLPATLVVDSTQVVRPSSGAGE